MVRSRLAARHHVIADRGEGHSDRRRCGAVRRAWDGGLVISNHGGHTVNNLHGTIDTLPEVAEAVGGRIEIYLDGGVRKGTDVLKALALGARAVFIGRPTFWGLTLGGEAGVAAVLEILKNELWIDAGRCGVRDLACVDSRLVHTLVPTAHGASTDSSASAPGTCDSLSSTFLCFCLGDLLCDLSATC